MYKEVICLYNKQKKMQKVFEELSENYRSFIHSQECPVLDFEEDFNGNMEEFQFYFLQHHVSQNKPVIIRNMINHWPALSKWKDNTYLLERLQDKQVNCTITPNGRADCVTYDPSTKEKLFVKPFETQIAFSDLQQIWSTQHSTPTSQPEAIYYLQEQNGNFCNQSVFEPLWKDVDLKLPWANRVFNQEAPDAINNWMGNQHKVSSLHKDFYENLYAVVRGTKTFYLLPPTDLPFMKYQSFAQGHWNYDAKTKEWKIEKESQSEHIPWLDWDASREDDVPKHCNPLRIDVHESEILYLPSLWFHQVHQQEDSNGLLVAINYWFDMNFASFHSIYFQFLQSLNQV